MSSRRREQILENCRWLFGHDVQIVTFAIRSYLKQTPNSQTNSGPYELHYYATVLPKTCSLPSRDFEDKILLKEFHLLSSDGATSKLLETVEKKIGMMLETNNGRISMSPLGEGKVNETPVVQQATSKAPPPPVVTPKKPVGAVQPEEADPMTIVPEQTKRFFQALLEKPPSSSSTRRASWGTATTPPSSIKHLGSKPAGNTRREFLGSIEQNSLTAYNLSLLENEHKNTEPKSPKKCHPRRKPRPIILPKLATNMESPSKPPRAILAHFELSNRVAELEKKLHALEALVRGQQAGPFHFRESPGPIMTPATSVASTGFVDVADNKLVAELESEVPLQPTLPPTSGEGLGARAFLFA